MNRKDKMLLLLDQTLRASQLEKEGGIDLILFEVLIVAVLGSLVFFFYNWMLNSYKQQDGKILRS